VVTAKKPGPRAKPGDCREVSGSASALSAFVTRDELREWIDALRDELKSDIDATKDLLVTAGVARHEKAMLRIEAVEEKHLTFSEDLRRVPTDLDKEADAIRALFNEKLNGLATHLEDLRHSADQFRIVSEKNIETAFTAAEKVSLQQRVSFEQQIAKSEASFTKEMDGVKALLHATASTINADVRNLTTRLDRGEGTSHGARQESTDRHANSTLNVLVGGLIVNFVVMMLGFGGLWASTHNPINPIVGADTKRVDDLITAMTENSRQVNDRLNSLSQRLNSVQTSTLTVPSNGPIKITP
jgi:hypothetical protein